VNNADPIYQHPDADPLLDEKESADILRTTPGNMKQSRYTGTLFGKPAPKFIKMGRRAKYRRSQLLQFIAQFEEYQSTSEYQAASPSSRKGGGYHE
jgi:hypothetical protein